MKWRFCLTNGNEWSAICIGFALSAVLICHFIFVISLIWRGIMVTSLVSINEVNLCWARLILGWVTVSGFDSRRRHFISVCNQPPRSTQPSFLRGMVKWVPAKGRWCSAAWCNLQIKLCDPCLSALEVVTMMRYTNWRIPCFILLLV